MSPRVVVLGTAQDGGVPHAGCACPACAAAHADPTRRRRVACVAVLSGAGRALVVDATPDLPGQLHALADLAGRERLVPDALLLTHAHVGHYLGLAWLGREAMDTSCLPVHASARMAAFLRANRPWSRLEERGQAEIRVLEPGTALDFDGVRVTPFLVPHRAEDTDTLGLEVAGPARRLVYVPDADRFPTELADRIREADVALVDGTFHDAGELPGRDLSEIPHPFVAESLEVLAGARGRVWFTHLNHSNALLDPDAARRPVLPEPFGVLEDGAAFDL